MALIRVNTVATLDNLVRVQAVDSGKSMVHEWSQTIISHRSLYTATLLKDILIASFYSYMWVLVQLLI